MRKNKDFLYGWERHHTITIIILAVVILVFWCESSGLFD